MKRIVSLDFFRGLAMICMLGFHVLIHVSWHAQASNYTDIGAMAEQGMLPLLVLVFILANFRALFLMVSMTIHGYILAKTLPKGNAQAILKKNLFFALMLYIVALFTESIAANWGILGRSIAVERWAPEAINRVMHFETLNSIAVSIFVLTLVFYIFNKKGILNQPKAIAKALGIGAVLIVIAHAIIQVLMNQYWPEYYLVDDHGYGIRFDPADNTFPEQYTWASAGGFFLKLVLSAFIGVEQPIFPFMATTFIGGIVGVYLAQEKVSPQLPKRGMLVGLLILVSGGIWLAADFSAFSLDFNVFPPWFYLFTTGLQLFLLMLLLRMVEFSNRVANSEKMDKFIKKTTFVRRWGIVSLTLFVWQLFPELLMRWIGTKITGGEIDFINRGQAGGGPSLLMIILVIVVWDMIFRLWEKAKFKGSFEWLMATIGAKVLNRRQQKGKDSTPERLNIEAVLYHPEPIVFVEPPEELPQ